MIIIKRDRRRNPDTTTFLKRPRDGMIVLEKQKKRQVMRECWNHMKKIGSINYWLEEELERQGTQIRLQS